MATVYKKIKLQKARQRAKNDMTFWLKYPNMKKREENNERIDEEENRTQESFWWETNATTQEQQRKIAFHTKMLKDNSIGTYKLEKSNGQKHMNYRRNISN